MLNVTPICSKSIKSPGKDFARHGIIVPSSLTCLRTANFNPDTPSGVGWVRKLPQLNDTVIAYNDEFQRSRLRALQAVDEMVEEIVKRLDAKGILDNTYIFYSTDNVSPANSAAVDISYLTLLIRATISPSIVFLRAKNVHTKLISTSL
jgi:hypothetical protein